MVSAAFIRGTFILVGCAVLALCPAASPEVFHFAGDDPYFFHIIP
jgi:hypothetical protein